ncbi:hypothetical protein BJV74DRAFT_827094 [Russula compacta]|nr:hypothetical protein BJV74DRAFT_827094 [Russula compacta]
MRLTLPLILSSLYISFSQAQSPPACAVTCASQAGCDLSDTTCICTNPTFIASASSCVAVSCSPADTAAAETYIDALCAGAGVSGSGNRRPILATD